ncbi:hypothetical protein BHE74_00009466 [Ensete ventricosum]|nr:hypothetical protein BHE74_00009466 [Ensete ventricosum]
MLNRFASRTMFLSFWRRYLGQTRRGAQVSVSQASIGCRALRSKQPKSSFAVHENAEGGRIVGEKPRAKSCAKTQVNLQLMVLLLLRSLRKDPGIFVVTSFNSSSLSISTFNQQ